MKDTRLIVLLSVWVSAVGPQTWLSAADWPTFPPTVIAPTLTKVPGVFGSAPEAEAAPILYRGEPLLLESYRPAKPWDQVQPTEMYLAIKSLRTGERVAGPFGYGYSMASACVMGDEISVFASRVVNGLGADIYRFTSTDLVHWTEPAMVVQRTGDETLYNSSVALDGRGYVMAYESNKPVQFCVKFARSTDLANWQKIDVPTFAGPNGDEYSACPMIRRFGDWYYAIYLHAPIEGHNGWITYIARSKNLAAWEYSENNPILEAGVGEGVNNSDIDLFEFNNKTYLFYSAGDQATWGNTQLAVYDGSPQQLLESYFLTVPEPGAWILLGTAVVGIVVYALHKRR